MEGEEGKIYIILCQAYKNLYMESRPSIHIIEKQKPEVGRWILNNGTHVLSNAVTPATHIQLCLPVEE